jgi:gliding motility-associatede transport system auxiliary component
MKDKSKILKKHLLQLGIIVLLLVGINLLAAHFYTRWDLTAEKRFTLSNSTKKILRNLKGTVYVSVYLDGKMPAGFKHLEESTRELLDEFREYGNGHIVYKFIDPSALPSDSDKEQMYDTLVAKGLRPYNLQVQLSASEGYSEKLIFPGALVDYDGKETAIDLLQSQEGQNSLESLNNADALLEYKLADAIYHLQLKNPPLVGYMLGNGELLGPEVNDALQSLSQKYLLDTIDLYNDPYIPQQFQAIVFEKPSKPFTEGEKIKIDQYLMHGGKIIWFIDDLNADMDSLRNKNDFIAFDKGLQLQDMLFNYGVRINPDLMEDLQCDAIPLVVGQQGNQPQIQLVPWPYFPLLTPTGNSPIVKNMDLVLGQFVNTIDTVGSRGIKKTILLTSSAYSRIVPTPVKVSWESVKIKPRPQDFNQPYLIAAVLLEGKFTSLFQNRLDNTTIDSINRVFPQPFTTSGVPSAMIVVSDGDIITNPVSQKDGPLPMGSNEYTHAQYANREFFLNCMEYLTNNTGLMNTRDKTYQLRLMDATLISRQKAEWQILVFVIPALFAFLIGIIFTFVRRRKYVG